MGNRLNPISTTSALYRWCKDNNVVAKFQKDGVTVLSLDDPGRRNFTSMAFMEGEPTEAGDRKRQDPGAR